MLETVVKLLRMTQPKRQKQFVWLMILVAFSSVVELVALGGLALFITGLTSPEAIADSQRLSALTSLFPDSLASGGGLFTVLGVGVACLLVVKNVVTAAHYYLAIRFDGAVNVDFGHKILNGFLKLPYSQMMRENSADILRIINWRTFAGMVFSSLLSLFCDLLVSILLLSSLFLLHPGPTAAALGTLLVVGFCIYRFFRSRIARFSAEGARLDISINRVLMKSVQGLKDIKLFNFEDVAVNDFHEKQTAYVHCLAKQRVYERAPVWVLESVGMGGLVLGSLAVMLFTETTSANLMATLSLVAVSAWRILPAIYRSIATLGTIRGYLPYLRRLLDFMEKVRLDNERVESAPHSTLPRFSDTLEVQDVSYRYDGAKKRALEGVSFQAPKGSLVGLIGRSGAGKSTLADVLIGLLKPDAGAVRIDGRTLDETIGSAWREQVGFVPQRPYLFDGTVVENIAFSVNPSEIDIERVHEAMKLAQVDEFLVDLPDGRNTMIGERGSLLSGGQAQRVSIARALYRRPELLLFDEATSSLDAKTENAIKETILSLAGDRTVLIIAHRLETIEQCDLVVWLEEGKTADVGPVEMILPRYLKSHYSTME